MSTMYELMRRSERMEEDGEDLSDLFYEAQEKEEDNEDFKAKYKRFYSDIKVSVKEDW